MNWPFKKKSYLEELHKPHNDYEKQMEELKKYLTKERISHHTKRIINNILSSYLGTHIKIDITDRNFTIRAVIEDGKLVIPQRTITEIIEKYGRLIVYLKIVNDGVQLGYRVALDPASYKEIKERTPLFFETYEMDDEDFELWFKLQ